MNERVQQWKAALLDQVWPKDVGALPIWRAFLTRVLQVAYALGRDLMDGQLTLRAMSLVYTTLLSMVPLLALTFSVLKGFGVHNQLEPMLLSALAALGDKGVEITKNIVGFVENIKVGVLGALGLGMLIYTVISLLHKIEQAFNYTWHITRSRPLGQRFSEYLSVVLVGPLLIFSAMGMTASLMSSSAVEAMGGMPGLGLVVAAIGKLIPYALVIAAFTFVYVFMPNTKVRISAALIGGIVAGVLWETSGWAFGAFVVSSGKYAAVYSGFAILIVFMIWLFISWLILLLGASIAFYCQHPHSLRIDRGEVRLSGLVMDKLSLMTMLYIGRRFYNGERQWSMRDLSDWLAVPLSVTESVVDILHDSGLLIHTDEASATYVPAMELEKLRIKDVLDRVRAGEDNTSIDYSRLPVETTVDEVLAGIDDSITHALGDQSLRDIILSHSAD